MNQGSFAHNASHRNTESFVNGSQRLDIKAPHEKMCHKSNSGV